MRETYCDYHGFRDLCNAYKKRNMSKGLFAIDRKEIRTSDLPTAYSTVKPLVERFGARGGLVILIGNARHASASYGVNKADCKVMKDLLDNIIDLLESGEVKVAWDY